MQNENTPKITISTEDSQIVLNLGQGVKGWEAIGLLETALLLLKENYSSQVSNENQSEK